jgi:hypothetical protein
MSKTVACPHCQGQILENPQLAGEVVVCPHCQGKFRMPIPQAQMQEGALDFLEDAHRQPQISVQRRPFESPPSHGKIHVLTERTSKQFKLMMLFGVVMTIGGCVVSVNANNSNNPDYVAGSIGSLVMLGGIVLFVVGKILAWWHHG